MSSTQNPQTPSSGSSDAPRSVRGPRSWSRLLRRLAFVGACLATLIGLFYAVENWRGRRAWDERRRELEARGEVIDWNAFIPAAVPDDQNFYKAPHMAEWFVKGSLKQTLSGAGAGKEEQAFPEKPRPEGKQGTLTVAEIQVVAPSQPLPPGKPDAVLRWDDPAASARVAALLGGCLGPCLEGARGCIITARPFDRKNPLYLIIQAEKVPSAARIAEFLPRGPSGHDEYNPYAPRYFKVDAAGANGFLVSLQQSHYAAAEYLDVSQPAVADFDLLRQALQRPYARMDSDYQRPFEHPVPNFVRLRSVAQMLSMRAQCYLLLKQPEAAWHELELVRDVCHMLEAKPASNCPTLVEAMISVAIGGLYVSVVQDGLRLQVWREPELEAMQKQLAGIDYIPLLKRAFEAERAAACRTFETYSPSELKKLFDTGHEKEGWWGKLRNPLFLYAALAPRGWMFQNMCAGAPRELGLLSAFDVPNAQIWPGRIEGAAGEINSALQHKTPYNLLAAMAFPNFLKATQAMARNQTLANEAYIACALERYRLAHREYPKTLEALVPQFAARLPHDLVGGGPLKYTRTVNDSFELYSVGWNGKDDGAVTGKTAAEGDWVWQ